MFLTQLTETICDDNGVELIVSYDADKSDEQIEEGHGFHNVGGGVSIELTSVEIVIKNSGIDILPNLTKQQTEFLISKLNP